MGPARQAGAYDNKALARIFREIGDMLEIKGEDPFRINAYRRAADAIEAHPVDLRQLWQEDRLREVPRVGEAIAKKIDELLRTGKLDFHAKLRVEFPESLLTLLKVPGVGPKTAKLLFDKLGIATLADLEKAAREGRLRTLPGLGARSEERILQGIEMQKRIAQRVLLGEALPLAEEYIAWLKVNSRVRQIEPAGSLRRRKPTIGDLDILATTKSPSKVIAAFVAFPLVAQVQAQGGTKASVILESGLQVDLRVLEEQRFGSSLQYFTGSKEHNVQLRELALDLGLSLSEYGFTRVKDKKEILCPTEEEVYQRLGLPWIPPELREALGEVGAARRGKLPELISADQLLGDFQSHTTYSDGSTSIEEMARAAKAYGLKFLLITDHTKSLGVTGGMDASVVRKQRKEIEAVNQKLAPFKVLAGAEVEVKGDGTLDLPDKVLAGLDMVVASLHTGLRQERARFTARMVAALRNPYVDLIAHPYGILLGQREGADLDFEAIVAEAAQTGTMLEINAHPSRLDLDGEHARMAIQAGVMLAISSDSHTTDGFAVLPFGVATARRGWCEAAHIANTLPWEKLRKRLKSYGAKAR